VGQFQVDDMGQFQSELIVTSKPESVDLCDRILQMAKAINPKPPKMTKKALAEEKPLKVNMTADELLKLALNTPIKKKKH